jgi:GTP-binding protein HflX
MFERPRAGERAVLVHLDIGHAADPESVEEFRQLAVSAGAEVAGLVGGARPVPDARYFIGSGKADELKALVESEKAELVIFDHALSPAQERNLERHLQCRVLDRSGLILDIFAQRARSFEGKLQVELAQLEHLSTRLVRGWTHLERQKGGIGLRGPGETQLETDRRLLAKRIAMLGKRLDRIVGQRAQGRRARAKAELPSVSLVGYTNAGKSTLFNRLTRAGVYQADQLFATLDPTLRRLPLPDAPAVILADTVGFINHLPHELVAAFRSTLEETRNAELLLHVVDAASHRREGSISDVEEVLTAIGVDKLPQIQVFNKIDLLEDARPRLERDADGRARRVWLSAETGEGIDLLLAALAEHFREDQVYRLVSLQPADGALRGWCYRNGRVLAEHVTEAGGWQLEILVPRVALDRLRRRDPRAAERLLPRPAGAAAACAGV